MLSIESREVHGARVAAQRLLLPQIVIMLEVRHHQLAQRPVDRLAISQPGVVGLRNRTPVSVQAEDGDYVIVVVPAFTKKPSIEGGALWAKLERICSLRDGLVGGASHRVAQDAEIIGRLYRGDADTCAEDAIAVVGALRPEFLPSILLDASTSGP